MAKSKPRKKRSPVTPPAEIYIQVGRNYNGEPFTQHILKNNLAVAYNGTVYSYKLVGPIEVKVTQAVKGK